MSWWYLPTKRWLYPGCRRDYVSGACWDFCYPFLLHCTPAYRRCVPSATYFDEELKTRFWTWYMNDKEGYIYFEIQFRGYSPWPEPYLQNGESFTVNVSYNLVLREVYIYTKFNRLAPLEDWEVVDIIEFPWIGIPTITVSEEVIQFWYEDFPEPILMNYVYSPPYSKTWTYPTDLIDGEEIKVCVKIKRNPVDPPPITSPPVILAQAFGLPTRWIFSKKR